MERGVPLSEQIEPKSRYLIMAATADRPSGVSKAIEGAEIVLARYPYAAVSKF
jgi:hypothetical protein